MDKLCETPFRKQISFCGLILVGAQANCGNDVQDICGRGRAYIEGAGVERSVVSATC